LAQAEENEEFRKRKHWGENEQLLAEEEQ